jgi:hypothetical protein
LAIPFKAFSHSENVVTPLAASNYYDKPGALLPLYILQRVFHLKE